MANMSYDIVVVGGGIAGAALAHGMAGAGCRVLVLERESKFRDRVRGEGMHAWGVPEARKLGVYEAMVERCGIEVPWWDIYLGDEQFAHRNFMESTPHGSPLVSFYHPAMQEVLIELAGEAGAEIWRGARVTAVRPGRQPEVTVARGDWVEVVRARLVVGADGRNSPTRKWGGFESQSSSDDRKFTGVLLEGMEVPQDTWLAYMNPGNGLEAMLTSVGNGRVRAYLGHPSSAKLKLNKAQDFPAFVDACVAAGANREAYSSASLCGPMATFAADDQWVEHPCRDGIALVGDAAATCDPTLGQGLALTLRDVRMLRDFLLADDDWERAGHAYADAQCGEYTKIRTLETWYRSLFLETGSGADKRRAHALPLIAEEPERLPDLFGMGPDSPTDEAARRRLFGEDRPRRAA